MTRLPRLERCALVLVCFAVVFTSAAPTPAIAADPPRWRPTVGMSWQWQLTSPVDDSVRAQVFDIDLFDNSAAVVARLHARGSKAICYVSAGSWENWRPDAAKFPRSVLGRSNGWPGERWLDIRQIKLLAPIMAARMELCRAKGFDGIELDNVDGYSNRTGFPITAAHQLAYNRWLAAEAHKRGLAVGLKNDVEQARALEPHFDFAINEQCFEYDECDELGGFIRAGKPVFHVEYDLRTGQFCREARAMRFSSMRKRLDLDAWRQQC